MGPIDDLPRPLAVAIHDAGAANMIAAWAEAAAAPPETIWAEGPAAAIWSARFGDVAQNDPDRLLDGAATLLSGTGWASDLEHAARHMAAQRGVASIAVIDHWVNYRARFERDGEVQWPDAIWVGDAEARVIAERELPGIPVTEQPNFYLAEQAAAAGPAPIDGDILFVAEPARSNWGADRPGEFQALDHFMAHRAAAGIAPDVPMRLRPHPSDPAGKYDVWIAEHPGVTLDRSSDLGEALAGAAIVVGLNSMALVIALAAGRIAISALPPNAPPRTLPQAAIRRL